MNLNEIITIEKNIQNVLLPQSISIIQDENKEHKKAKRFLLQNKISHFICNRILNNNFNYKQESYIIGLIALDLIQSEKYYSILSNNLGIKALAFSLISDNNTLVFNMGHVGMDLDIPRRNKGSLNLMLQCAMRDDLVGLNQAIKMYEKYAIKKEWNKLQVDFYKAYLDEDIAKITQILEILETPKLKRQSIFYKEFIDDYLSLMTSAYLKLCWRKGMNIQIDSSTVPMGMMPVDPLDSYDIEYPYLEGWENSTEQINTNVEQKIFESVGPYPDRNPILRNNFVSVDTVQSVVNRFCPNHTITEKSNLVTFIWEAYTDPENFDQKNESYLLNNNVGWPVTNANGDRVLEARPFWSELTKYDDEGFFMYLINSL